MQKSDQPPLVQQTLLACQQWQQQNENVPPVCGQQNLPLKSQAQGGKRPQPQGHTASASRPVKTQRTSGSKGISNDGPVLPAVDAQSVTFLTQFLLRNQATRQQLRDIVECPEATSRHFALVVNTPDLLEAVAEWPGEDRIGGTGALLSDRADVAIPSIICLLNEASKRAQVEMLQTLRAEASTLQANGLPGTSISVKGTRARLAHVPPCLGHCSIGEMRKDAIGTFVCISGTVTRVGPVKAVERTRRYRCSQCQYEVPCEAQPDEDYTFETPKGGCPNMVTHRAKGGGKGDSSGGQSQGTKFFKQRCGSTNFFPVGQGSGEMADYQEIRIQDCVQAKVGVTPKSISMVLTDDLVSCASPGDNVTVGGVVRVRWKPVVPDRIMDLELFVEVNHVRKRSDENEAAWVDRQKLAEQFESYLKRHREDEFRIRHEIIQAAVPSLYGMEVPKLALLLTLIAAPSAKGSSSGAASDAQRRWDQYIVDEADDPTEKTQEKASQATTDMRSMSHLLLVGDPGTGKSKLLQAALDLSVHGVRTTGLGCSSAGLTCCAVRDGPDWALEAGALVLADGGVCCIDEFASMKSQDRGSVHEAMEQQTVSVAKAGMVCRLNARCSVVAAQNCTKGGKKYGTGGVYNRAESLVVNIGLPPTLLSRFDLILVFADAGNGLHQRDDAQAEFVLNSLDPQSEEVAVEKASVDVTSPFAGHMREYIQWAKGQSLLGPMEPGAQEVILRYYAKSLRSAEGGVTVRAFEGLLRLSQAHARLMGRDRVKVEDAVAVALLHQAALQGHAVDATEEEDENVSLGTTGTLFQGRLEGMPQLHHRSGISCRAEYEQLERPLLATLGLTRDGGSVKPRQPLEATQDHPGRPPKASQTPPKSLESPRHAQEQNRFVKKRLGCR